MEHRDTCVLSRMSAEMLYRMEKSWNATRGRVRHITNVPYAYWKVIYSSDALLMRPTSSGKIAQFKSIFGLFAIFVSLNCTAYYQDDKEAQFHSQLCQLPGLKVVDRKSPEGRLFVAQLQGVLAATLTLSMELENTIPSRPLPLTIDLFNKTSQELVLLRSKDPNYPIRATWHARWSPGSRSNLPVRDVVYSLPYSASTHYAVMQGPFGHVSHQAGSGFENAIDWKLPIGTKVLAARAGTVIAVRSDSSFGGPDARYANCSNYVYIRHDDDTYGSYQHFIQDKVFVKPGDYVKEGELIGLSGDSGYATAPHLHFDVFRNVAAGQRITFPMKFRTNNGVEYLKEGGVY